MKTAHGTKIKKDFTNRTKLLYNTYNGVWL